LGLRLFGDCPLPDQRCIQLLAGQDSGIDQRALQGANLDADGADFLSGPVAMALFFKLHGAPPSSDRTKETGWKR